MLPRSFATFIFSIQSVWPAMYERRRNERHRQLMSTMTFAASACAGFEASVHG
jgi:hypothetical protein